MVALRSAPLRVERGDTRERSQRTRQGENIIKDNEQMGSEENRNGMKDQASITRNPFRVGRRAGDSTPSATPGECICGVSTGDEAGSGNTHPAWRRI